MSKKQLQEFAKKYDGRVAKLLSVGRRGLMTVNENMDYVKEFGFNEDDVKELLILADDMDIYDFDYSGFKDNEGLEFYGVIHAWYALSQLKVPEAKDIFIKLIESTTDDYHDDWVLSGFRDLIAPYRKEIYQYFIETIKSESYDRWVRVEYINVLKDMIEAKEIEISILNELIEYILNNSKDEIVNASMINVCIELKLTEYLPLISKCFDEEIVDIDFIGDFEDVEIAMGIKEKREKPRVLTEKQKIFESFAENLMNIAKNKTTSYVKEKSKLSRNDPCPCGSGKKYKKCCLN
ncbi:MAG: DUF1186 domain-containing protein [Campylobacterales bacterium]|nr:DUF1186 domain-containing protein [Campylobacterales bacterium]